MDILIRVAGDMVRRDLWGYGPPPFDAVEDIDALLLYISWPGESKVLPPLLIYSTHGISMISSVTN